MNVKTRTLFFVIAYFSIGYFNLSQAQILHDATADSLIYIFSSHELSDSAKYLVAMDISDYATSPKIKLKYAQKALEIAIKHQHNSRQAAAWLNMGQAYKKLGDHEKALSAMLKSISHYQSANSKLGVSSAYLAIGNLYTQQQNYLLALKYFNQSIQIFRDEQDTSRLSTALLNTGMIYHQYQDYDSALLYLQEAKTLFETIEYDIGIAYALGNMGLVKTSQGEYEGGHEYLTEAINMLQQMGDNYPITEYLLSMAEIYQEKGDIHKTIEYADQSWHIAQQDSLMAQMRDASHKLSELYAQQKDYEKAYQYQSTYLVLRDSLNNEEVIRNMADMRTEFEVAQKQTEIDLLEKSRQVQRLIQYGLTLLISLLLIIAMLLYGNNKLHRKVNRQLARQKDELHEKNEALDALNITREKFFSIISHDLRGPVNTFPGLSGLIKAFVHEKNYTQLPEIATHIEKAALHLSMLLDNLLSWAVNQQGGIPTHPERLCVNDIAEEVIGIFQTMAFSKKINLYSRIEKPLYIWADSNAFFTILRNLINNALKFTPFDGEVYINAHKEEEQVSIQVTDTGVGMSQEKVAALFHEKESERTWGTSGEKGVGLGLQLVYEFIRLGNGSITVNSIEGQGSTFVILLPAFKEEVKVCERS